MNFIRNHRFWILLLCVVVLVCASGVLWLILSQLEAQPETGVPVGATTTTTTTAFSPVQEGNMLSGEVLEVGEDWLLLQMDAGSTIVGQVRVYWKAASSFSVGERVAVWHTGQMMPSLPPQMVATRMEKIG